MAKYPNLEAEMVRFGISQSDLALFLNVSTQSIVNWMTGNRGGTFSIDDALAVSEHFFDEAEPSYLFAQEPIAGGKAV